VVARRRGARDIWPARHHPDVSNAGNLPVGIAHQELRLDLAQVGDENKDAHHGVVRNAGAAMIQDLPQGAPGHTANLADSLESSADPRLVPVLRGEVRSRELHQVLVRNQDTEVCFLMTDQAQAVTTHVNGAALQSHLPEEWMTEDHHHGAVGRRSQPDGWVAAATLEGTPDEEPWISTGWLDEGVGQATAWFHVHAGHVDLNDVAPTVVEVYWGSSKAGDEWSSGAPGSVVGGGSWCGMKSGGGEANGRRAIAPMACCG